MQENFLYKYCKTHGKIATNIIVAVYFLFALGIFISYPATSFLAARFAASS